MSTYKTHICSLKTDLEQIYLHASLGLKINPMLESYMTHL